MTSTATLVDGASVTVRCLTPDDCDAVVSLAVGLSEEERYLRFFTGHPTYVDEWALSLTAPADGVVALGVFEAGELIGVANYAELSRPGYAEIAVVVAHEQHERGVGTALLRALGHIARSAGQHRFVADVLFENYVMRRVLRDAGWPITQHRDGSVVSVEVDLDDTHDATSS
jgi:RimJ/RimL family protein N-acetyltransferase